jgi:hypothetical protein
MIKINSPLIFLPRSRGLLSFYRRTRPAVRNLQILYIPIIHPLRSGGKIRLFNHSTLPRERGVTCQTRRRIPSGGSMKSKLVMMQVALLLGWVAFTGFAGVEPARAMSLPAQPAGGAAVAPARENLSASPDQDGALLENLLVRERLALSNQQSRLTLSHTVAESTQEYITRQKQAGKDTAALEAALAALNQAIGSSEGNHE